MERAGSCPLAVSAWPDYAERSSGLSKEWLPRVEAVHLHEGAIPSTGHIGYKGRISAPLLRKLSLEDFEQMDTSHFFENIICPNLDTLHMTSVDYSHYSFPSILSLLFHTFALSISTTQRTRSRSYISCSVERRSYRRLCWMKRLRMRCS